MRGSARLIFVAALVLSACQQNGPTVPTLVPTFGPPDGDPTPTAAPVGVDAPTAVPTPSRPAKELIVCQNEEPLTLYRYAEAGPSRADIFEALYDGPVDQVGYQFSPVILGELPSLDNDRLTVEAVSVSPGDRVVDATTLQVVTLAEGVTLAQLDGTTEVYTGTAPAEIVQVTATFVIRSGVMWSDGQPVTAADSVFSYQLAQLDPSASTRFVTARTAGYEAVDDQTVRWTGMPGWRDLDYALRFFAPMPAHVYAGVDPAAVPTREDASTTPLGWGAFRVVEWRRGERLVMERNPYYFRATEGLPKVDRVVFRFGVAADQALADMQAGLCHIAAESQGLTSLMPQLREVGATGALQVRTASTNTYEHLDFGMLPAEDYQRPAGEELFIEPEVRQAIAYCIDRPALLEKLQNGAGEIANTYVPAGHPFYAGPQLSQYAFNPERGQDLLDAAGWVAAEDGSRSRGGTTLALTLTTGPESSPFRQQLVQTIVDQLLTNCGIAVTPAWQTQEALYAPWPSGPLFGRRFDLGAFPWRAGHQPPCELYLSRAIPDAQNPAGTNNLGYRSDAFDNACDEARGSFDPAVQRQGHVLAQTIFSQELPSLPLFFRFRLGVARPEVQGYRLDASAASSIWNIEEIGLP
jgi:peptide/nickel transport system substrate-binding protein